MMPLPDPVVKMQLSMAAAMTIDHLQSSRWLPTKKADAIQRYLSKVHEYIQMTTEHGSPMSMLAQTPMLFTKVWPPSSLRKEPYSLQW